MLRGVDEIGFGRGFKALRVRKRLRQDDLAREAGVSRGAIARIESGHAASVTVDTLEKVARPLGARVVCRLTWNGEGLDRLLDADHAAVVEQIVRVLRDGGWIVATEASFNIWGERGSIDVLAFQPGTRMILVVEVRTVVPDAQATLVTLDRKVRLSLEIARDRGWDAIAAGKLLVIKDSRTARRRVEARGATFDTAFPDRIARIRSWIRAPEPERPLRGLWFLPNESQAVARQRVRKPRLPAERGSTASS